MIGTPMINFSLSQLRSLVIYTNKQMFSYMIVLMLLGAQQSQMTFPFPSLLLILLNSIHNITKDGSILHFKSNDSTLQLPPIQNPLPIPIITCFKQLVDELTTFLSFLDFQTFSLIVVNLLKFWSLFLCTLHLPYVWGLYINKIIHGSNKLKYLC